MSTFQPQSETNVAIQAGSVSDDIVARQWKEAFDRQCDDTAFLRAENARLRRALQFYASEWQPNGDGDPSTPGLGRSWTEPTEELFNDKGFRARAALKGDAS